MDADKNNKEVLEAKGIDTTGKSYLDTTEAKSALDGNSENTDGGRSADEASKDENTAKRTLDGNKSLTITAAMAGGWNGKAGVGAGIAYSNVKNDIAADIKNSVIQADINKFRFTCIYSSQCLFIGLFYLFSVKKIDHFSKFAVSGG